MTAPTPKCSESPSEEAVEAASKCGGCGGPYRYDISVPSAVWNEVIRARGLSEYLCGTCILYEFAQAGRSFTARLWGEGFGGTPIEIRIGGNVAVDAAAINDENNRLRTELREAREQGHPRRRRRRPREDGVEMSETEKDQSQRCPYCVGYALCQKCEGSGWIRVKRTPSKALKKLAGTGGRDGDSGRLSGSFGATLQGLSQAGGLEAIGGEMALECCETHSRMSREQERVRGAVAVERARWEKVVAGLVEALETLVSNVDCARGLLQNSPIEANGGNWGILSTTKATAALAAAREMMEGI